MYLTAVRALVVVLLTSFVCLSASAQCTKKLSELPAAPELLGFRIGMTKEEIKALVPQTVFGKTDPFGVQKTTINPHFDPKIDKTKFETVRSISLDILDERLTSLWIGFDETYKVQALDEFVKQISQSFGVPVRWSSWKTRGQQLRCSDFQLFVSQIAGGPSVRVVDVAAEDTIASRRRAKEEQDSAAEATANNSDSELIGDKQAKVYYSNGCQPSREIPEPNKITFKTAEEAEKAGFKLAKNCP